MESTGRFEGYLIGSDDVGHETPRDHFSVRNPKALLGPGGLESRARQHLDQTVADELAKVSLPMPLPGTPFHKYLYEAFVAQYMELSEIAYKRHHGNYSAVFELPHEAPLSIDKTKAASPSETLSVVFEHWARNHRHMGDGKRDVEKTAGSIRPLSSASLSCLAISQLSKSSAGRLKSSTTCFVSCHPKARASKVSTHTSRLPEPNSLVCLC